MKENHAQAEVSQKAYEARQPTTASARRITAHDVRHLCGGVSDMTIWRWLRRDELDFPKPKYIGKRRYWNEAEVLLWLDAQSVEAS